MVTWKNQDTQMTGCYCPKLLFTSEKQYLSSACISPYLFPMEKKESGWLYFLREPGSFTGVHMGSLVCCDVHTHREPSMVRSFTLQLARPLTVTWPWLTRGVYCNFSLLTVKQGKQWTWIINWHGQKLHYSWEMLSRVAGIWHASNQSQLLSPYMSCISRPIRSALLHSVSLNSHQPRTSLPTTRELGFRAKGKNLTAQSRLLSSQNVSSGLL